MTLGADDRGSVTAEFALVAPAAVLVVLLAVATLGASARQVRLEQAAASAARLAARGEDEGTVRATVERLVPGATTAIRSEGDVVCVEAQAPSAVPLPLPAIRASSCALAGGL